MGNIGTIGHDPDLDPCPKGHDGLHSPEWVEGGRCTLCGAGSIEEVEEQLAKEKNKVSHRDFVATDRVPLERNGRKHLTGIMANLCWCKPILVPDHKLRRMIYKHNDPERGVKGET